MLRTGITGPMVQDRQGVRCSIHLVEDRLPIPSCKELATRGSYGGWQMRAALSRPIRRFSNNTLGEDLHFLPAGCRPTWPLGGVWEAG